MSFVKVLSKYTIRDSCKYQPFLMNYYSQYGFKEFNYDQIYVSLSRSISAVPAHGVFGVFMGYFFMKFAFLNKNKKGNLFLCFFVPFLLHGIYNFLIGESILTSNDISIKIKELLNS